MYGDRRPNYRFLYLDQVTQLVGGKNTDTGKCNTHSSPPPDRQTDPSACLVFPLTVITNNNINITTQCHVKCKWSQSEKEANISEDMAGISWRWKRLIQNQPNLKKEENEDVQWWAHSDNEHEHECVNVRCPLSFTPQQQQQLSLLPTVQQHCQFQLVHTEQAEIAF